MHRAHELGVEGGLSRQDLLPAPPLDPPDPLVLGVADEPVEGRLVLVGEGDGELADPGEPEAELGAQAVPELVARPLEAALQRVRAGVVAAVDDPAVGLARAEADLGGALDQGDAQAVAAELVSDGAAHHAGADDHDVLQRAARRIDHDPGGYSGARGTPDRRTVSARAAAMSASANRNGRTCLAA